MNPAGDLFLGDSTAPEHLLYSQRDDVISEDHRGVLSQKTPILQDNSEETNSEEVREFEILSQHGIQSDTFKAIKEKQEIEKSFEM